VRDRVLALFDESHLLLEEGALALILASPTPLDLCRAMLAAWGKEDPIVTPDAVARWIERCSPKGVLPGSGLPGPLEAGGLMLEPPRLASPAPWIAPSGPRPFHLIMEGFIAPTEARAPLEGVTGLLRSRFRRLSRVLRGRSDLSALRPASEIARATGEAAVIGMVREVTETARQKLLILTLEDESGQVRVLIPKDHPAAKETYLPDEVLGVRLSLPKEPGKLPVARAILRPDVPVSRAPGRSERPSKALFLSDLHIGSKGFLEDPWNELMGFVRGEGPHGEVCRGLEHVVIAGDLVDGIGIYPHQERDLAIGDIVEQYAELGRRLKELPSYLNIVAVPGNHDAVSPAEPQPALPSELARPLPPNVHVVSNPSVFALEGVVVEAYHGRSFDDLIPQLPKMSYEQPLPVMKRMLSMRHLAPSYGMKTPLAPLPRDGLVIDPVPDIFVTGHTHTFGVERWRGILLLNASTWLAETDYQRMRNIRPVPARATVVDLQDGGVKALDLFGARSELADEVGPKVAS
jgi:DNA polymerase II small subunit